MREHRVPLVGDAWRIGARRSADIVASRDPKVQAVLTGLRDLADDLPGPEAGFRTELRTQLVAITERVIGEESPPAHVAEAAPVVASPAATTVPAAGRRRARHAQAGVAALPVARIVTATAALLVTAVLVLGGAVFASRGAVPGDTLYGLKRTDERVRLATDSATERPHDLLRFAARRVDESLTLAGRSQATALGARHIGAAARVNPATQELIRGALADFDSKVRQASRLLGGQAVSAGEAAPLRTLTSWTPHADARLSDLYSALDDTAVATRVAQSMTLLRTAGTRADSLAATVGCGCLATRPHDSLGPQPCTSCAGAPSSPARPSGPAPGSSPARHSSHPGSGAASSAPGGGTQRSTTPQPASSAPHVPALPSVSVQLPGGAGSQPGRNSSSAPVAVDSCGVQVRVGGLGVSVKTCPRS